MSLPVHIRVSILNLLGQQTQDDLTNLTSVSKQMHKDCKRPGFEWKIISTIVISASQQGIEIGDSRTRTLVQNLAYNQTNKKLDRYSHMRINDIHKFDYIYEGELKRITKDVQLEGIVSLDGSFTLVASAIVLALLNSFVTKATRQYNHFGKRRRLQEENKHSHEVVENSTTSGSHHDKNNDDDTKKITASSSLSSTILRPIPVMFTDTYRWLLRRQRSIAAASKAQP